jgi:hypothetical protein
MPTVADRAEAPTAIQTNLAAIFTSLELSRSIWLITSLSPGCGEKMSKHSVPAGDIAALLARFSELKQKALARELCGILGDGVNQAADFFSDATSIPSRNVTPLTIFGN